MSKKTLLDLKLIFPFLKWTKNYKKEYLSKDFIAGLTVAVILIPQVMAYAILAGLPPVYGLYAAFLGTAVAALWGSSKQLSTGPVALVSFLVLTALLPLAQPESPEFIILAIMLALMIGVIQLLMGVFKLGFIMNFISHSVIVGFTTAAAIIIASTQFPNLFGFSVEKHEFVYLNFIEIFLNLPQTHPLTLIIGVVSLITIVGIKKNISKAFPAALFVMVIGTIFSFGFNFEDKGVAILGNIQATLTMPQMPNISVSEFLTLLPKALIIAIVGFLEAYAIAKAIGAKTKDKIDVNQELIGQGLSNISSSFFKGYPVAGSFSRTAVNYSAGAITGLSSVFVSIFVLITILFLTPLLYYLPKAILAAIVMAAVVELVDFKKFKEVYHLSRTDGVVVVSTFVFSFLIKPDDAIFIGIILSLILFLRKTVIAQVMEQKYDSEEDHIVNIDETDKPKELNDTLLITIDRSIYFANVQNIICKIEKLLKLRGNKINKLLINFSSVNYVDVSAAEELKEYFDELREKGIHPYSLYRKKVIRGILDEIEVFEKECILKNRNDFKRKLVGLDIPKPKKIKLKNK